MKEGSLLGTVTAVAYVPFERVRALLTPDGALTLLAVTDRSPDLTIGVEPNDGLVWMHGGYWYQGEYLFAAHPDGTEVTYRVRNVSGQPDFAIRLWQRRTLRDQQRQLDQYVAALAQRL